LKREKKNKKVKAKSMTQLEFVHCMKEIAEKATQQQRLRGTTPLYIFDNPSVHVGEDAAQLLAAVGVSEDQVLQIAPYSPDFNQPIEHAFASLKASFRNHLYNTYQLTGAEVSPRDLQRSLRDIFLKITPASVMADALRLPDLWDVVRSRLDRVFVCRDNKQRKGTAGNWPRVDER
jgi:transposase